jgi:tetratricopeptide (TPR) repeat protein
VHLRRGDNGWNLCALLLLALFWTNPLILLAWRYYRLDQELSCDALALAHCNGEQQKRYARTLLDSLESLSANNSQPALSAWDDLRDLKERSLMIKHHLVTNTRRSTMLCTLMLLALLGGSVTITFAELANAAEPAETQITRIMELLNQGDSEGARAELEPLLQAGEAGDLNTDQYLRALHISSGLHIKAKNYSKARDDLETSLQLPNLPQETVIMINYAIGQSYIVSEDWPQAIVYISRYLAMTDGDKPGPLYLIAVAHYQQKQYVEATSYMERLFALPEQDFQESWYALLNALYAQTEQWDKAREVNEKMVELFDNPDDEKRLEMLNSGDAENI